MEKIGFLILSFLVLFSAAANANCQDEGYPEGYERRTIITQEGSINSCFRVTNTETEGNRIVETFEGYGGPHTQISEYDSHGNLIYQAAGTHEVIRHYEYDEKGRIIETSYIDYEDNLAKWGTKETRTYTSNEDDYIYENIYYDNGIGIPNASESTLDGSFREYYYEWEEDEDGNMVGRKITDDSLRETVELYKFDGDGNIFVYSIDDENLEHPSAKYGLFGTFIESYEYDESGKKTAYDRYGHRIERQKKRIYTVDEAAKLSKPTGNTIKLRYK